jgi:Na+-exporting ATPase
MGIETSPPDVEESTEPPICPFTDRHTSISSNHTCEVKAELGADKLEYPATLEVSTPQPYKTANAAFNNDDESSAHCAHTLSPEQLATLLQVDVQNGLSSTEAATRLERDGPNRVQEIEGVSTWKILLRQVSNSLTMV